MVSLLILIYTDTKAFLLKLMQIFMPGSVKKCSQQKFKKNPVI